VAGSLLSDYQMVVNSINLGTPLVKSNSSSKIARGIAQFARSLSSPTAVKVEEPKPRRFWGLLSSKPAS
jgi:hypothetical protein